MAELFLKERVYYATANKQTNNNQFGGIESKSPTAWLLRKDNISIVLEFASVFIHQAGAKGKKGVTHMKGFTLATGKRVGDSEAGPTMGYVQSLNKEIPCVNEKRKLLELMMDERTCGKSHLKINSKVQQVHRNVSGQLLELIHSY